MHAAPFFTVHSIVHWAASHAGGGSTQVPLWQVAPAPQSESAQHWLLQMH